MYSRAKGGFCRSQLKKLRMERSHKEKKDLAGRCALTVSPDSVYIFVSYLYREILMSD